MDKKPNLKVVGKIELPSNDKPKKKPYFKTKNEVNGRTFEDHATNSLADFMPNHLKKSIQKKNRKNGRKN